MDFEDIVLSETSQSQRANMAWLVLHEAPRVVRFIETESRWQSPGAGSREEWEAGVYGTEFKLEKVRKFWKWMVVTASPWECTSCHWSIHLKMVKMANLLCVFYHNLKKKKLLSNFILSRTITSSWFHFSFHASWRCWHNANDRLWSRKKMNLTDLKSWPAPRIHTCSSSISSELGLAECHGLGIEGKGRSTEV